MSTMEAIGESLMKGQADQVKQLVTQALEEGKTPTQILNDGLISGMMALGERFKKGEAFLPEVLFAARAMKGAMEILEPALVGHGASPAGKVLLGTVKGDIHDIGKNLVGVMLKGSGFEVVDIGVDASPDKFVAAIKQHNPQVVGLSAVLGTCLGAMRDTIVAIASAGFSPSVKTMVGGPIVTSSFAAEIGADGYAPDAASAVDEARDLIAEQG